VYMRVYLELVALPPHQICGSSPYFPATHIATQSCTIDADS
jgi:hypothetical protein